MKRFIAGLAVFAIVILVFWYGGVDFNARGEAQGFSLLGAFATGLAAAAYPGFNK